MKTSERTNNNFTLNFTSSNSRNVVKLQQLQLQQQQQHPNGNSSHVSHGYMLTVCNAVERQHTETAKCGMQLFKHQFFISFFFGTAAAAVAVVVAVAFNVAASACYASFIFILFPFFFLLFILSLTITWHVLCCWCCYAVMLHACAHNTRTQPSEKQKKLKTCVKENEMK